MKKRRKASPASKAGARCLAKVLVNMGAPGDESVCPGIVASAGRRQRGRGGKNHADKDLTVRVKSLEMANAPDAVKAPGMVPDEQKFEPRSKGITTARKKKPKELAVITECCTGCVGYCPVEDCMFWVPDEDNPPFGRIQIDPIQCIGCKKCLSKGPDGCFLDGCPWDAIVMVDIAEVEKEVGPMAY